MIDQKREKELIFELNEKIAQLNNLIDTLIEISRYDNKAILFELTLERIASITNASAALLQISSPDGETQQYSFPPYSNISTIFDTSFKLESVFDFNNSSYHFTLAEKETRNGITNFSELDNMLLGAITKQVLAAIENRYLTNLAIEKQKIEQELVVAASIQQKIIPESLPQINGYDIAGINIPSREVGGDYYDCIRLGNEKYALVIADVTGKGVGAALLVSTLNAALNSYLEFDLPLTGICSKLNKLIYRSSPSDKFITFFIAVLDSVSGELDVVNAGHNPALLLRSSGSLEKIDAGGIGLGMFDLDIPFTGQKLTMDPGDTLLLYTDGIPEAMTKSEEEYSDQKLDSFFVENNNTKSETFIHNLIFDVKKHIADAPQSDDITALYLKRNI